MFTFENSCQFSLQLWSKQLQSESSIVVRKYSQCSLNYRYLIIINIKDNKYCPSQLIQIDLQCLHSYNQQMDIPNMASPKFRASLLIYEMSLLLNVVIIINVYINDQEVFEMFLKDLPTNILNSTIEALRSSHNSTGNQVRKKYLVAVLNRCLEERKKRSKWWILVFRGLSASHNLRILLFLVLCFLSIYFQQHLRLLSIKSQIYFYLPLFSIISIAIIAIFLINAFISTMKYIRQKNQIKAIVTRKIDKIKSGELKPQNKIIELEQRYESNMTRYGQGKKKWQI